MNYLAHAWLTRDTDEAILGAILGDFVHGHAASLHWPVTVRNEIQRHRHIDRYTDTHPAVVAARALFPDGRRRFAGIVLDVFFDHLLARDWTRWNSGPAGEPSLAAFTARVYRVLLANQDNAPPRLRAIAPRMAATDWLGSYRERDNVDGAVRGIATRLSRRGEVLVACLQDLRLHEPALESAFETFFPDLIRATARMVDTQA